VKHLPAGATERLAAWLAEAAIDVEASVVAAVVSHVEWLLATNPTINLTAVVEPLEALRLHALDSLLVLPEVNAAADGLLVDVGTGGGFPGLPLALASGRQALLVDSVAKKADAVRRYVVSQNLEPWILVSGERSEAVAREGKFAAAVVVARAVASLPSLVELAAPFLVSGGRFVAMKGNPEPDELLRGVRAAETCGLVERSRREYELPDGGERRMVVTYERTGAPRIALPRREGMATKRPLA